MEYLTNYVCFALLCLNLSTGKCILTLVLLTLILFVPSISFSAPTRAPIEGGSDGVVFLPHLDILVLRLLFDKFKHMGNISRLTDK